MKIKNSTSCDSTPVVFTVFWFSGGEFKCNINLLFEKVFFFVFKL